MGSSQVPDVGARSHGGYTALHIAAINSRHGVIELLVVVYKADTDVADFSGRKPIYYLAQSEKSVPGQRSSGLLRRSIQCCYDRKPFSKPISVLGPSCWLLLLRLLT